MTLLYYVCVHMSLRNLNVLGHSDMSGKEKRHRKMLLDG